MIHYEKLLDQLEYEIEDLATNGMNKPIELSEYDISQIAQLIINKDPQIINLFNMDPTIVLTHIDDEKYDWADFHNQLMAVIEWYKLNPLIKMFMSIT